MSRPKDRRPIIGGEVAHYLEEMRIPLRLAAVTDVPTEAQWRERSASCSPDWPHWYLKLCGRIEWKINSNHPMTAYGDHLARLKALAEELNIPFECYDYRTPSEIEVGAGLD